MSLGAANARFATSQDGTRIYADAVGDPSNPAVVFVHGFTLAADVFDKLFRNSQLLRRIYLVCATAPEFTV
jgi:pimeloyl-ACP methyl ester carboxylesterase